MSKNIDLSQFDDDFRSGTPAERSDMESVPDGKYQVVVERWRSPKRTLPATRC